MRRNQIILSTGGGGFTHGLDPELDDFCLRFVPSNPNIGYVGWASSDDQTRIMRFYSRFSNVAQSLSHLPMGASDTQTQDWLANKHMVYFGGGNTAELVTALSAGQTLSAFVSANKAGCVLAGVSAGGVCWFDWILSDSRGDGYAPLDGLCIVTGGICPHYSSERDRKPAFEQALSNHGPAFAVDDGACLVAVEGRVQSYFSARPGHAAYALIRQDGDVIADRLTAFE